MSENISSSKEPERDFLQYYADEFTTLLTDYPSYCVQFGQKEFLAYAEECYVVERAIMNALGGVI